MSFTFPPPKQLSHFEDEPSTFPYPNVPVDKRSCRLLGPTALVVQGLMGVLVIASLVLKRQREKPMRPWRIWLFDVSKQIFGQAFVHGLNLLISDIVANLAQGNPCDLYFLNVLIDTTLGVAYIYLIVHGANQLLTHRLHLKGFQSGQYGDPPSLAYWARQAAVYVLTILTMKLLVVGLFAVWPGIFGVAEWLLSWLGGGDKIQIIFVMGIFPIIMNILQFWLIDSIVKASASMSNDIVDDTAREPLFRDPDSDDEDDATIRARRRHDIETPPTPQHLAKPPPLSDQASEHKSSASASASASSSSSSTRIIESSSIRLHELPSSLSPVDSSSIVSPLSASSSTSSLRSKKSKRRSPPPPILRPPPLAPNGVSYMISMTPSPEPIRRTSQRALSSLNPESSPQKQARQRNRSTPLQGAARPKVSVDADGPAWNGWVVDEADVDDWAQKVGEEEWTGRRMGAMKAGLDVWGAKGAVEVS